VLWLASTHDAAGQQEGEGMSLMEDGEKGEVHRDFMSIPGGSCEAMPPSFHPGLPEYGM